MTVDLNENRAELIFGRIMIGLAILVLFSSFAMAAVPKLSPQNPKSVLQKNSHSSIEMMGGNAGLMFTILDVRKSADLKKKVERIVIDIGNQEGKALSGDVSFYHAELQASPPRLILDIAQTPNSKVSLDEVQKRLSKSITFNKTSLLMDPVTSNTNFVFDLKPGTKVRVFPVRGAKTTSKIVVDLVAQ